MTEIEQLKADLATLHAANNVQGTGPGFNQFVRTEIVRVADKIEELEAQEEPADEWAEIKRFIDQSPDAGSNPPVKRYIRHLEAKVAELDHELRCERIAGGKVRDDLKARIAEMEQHGRKVDQANHEHYGRLQDQIAIRDLKIEKLERQAPAERNREKLAELTTILNAIPPVCATARELVERRIEGVKREIQNNG